MFIDTHCHPYLAKKKSQTQQFDNFFAWWGKALISIATDTHDSEKCIAFSKIHSQIYASVGIHPCSVEFDAESLPYFIENLKSKKDLEQIVGIIEEYYKKYPDKIVAIGECWLDYYWIEDIARKNNTEIDLLKELQKYYFRAQIRLAKKLSIPFIIHNRDSWEDVWEILCQENYGNFVLHSFTEDYDYALKCLKKFPDAKISFSGIVTFKNAKDIQKAATKIPLKNIMIETDSPYLTPEPLRWKEENEPLFVKHVLDTLIDLRDEPSEEVSLQIYKNSLDFFSLNL